MRKPMVNHQIPMRKDKKTYGKPSDSYGKDEKTYGKQSNSCGER